MRGCCGHSENKSPRGSSTMGAKIGGKINILNKKFGFLGSTCFKLLRQIKRKFNKEFQFF
jgi:hypothetical protein